MTQTEKEILTGPMVRFEKALDVAVGDDFASDESEELLAALDALDSLTSGASPSQQIAAVDPESIQGKILVCHDVAYACWLNDEPQVELSLGRHLPHAVRMKMNHQHCVDVVTFVRMFLQKHGKLMSPELAMLGGNARQQLLIQEKQAADS